MTVDTVGKKETGTEPIKINTKLVTLEHLIDCLRKMLGTEKFMIEMRHDVYNISSEKNINAQDLISQCQHNNPNPTMHLTTTNPHTSVDMDEELVYRTQQPSDANGIGT
ncbi:hypothetical protein HD806DRAFT_500615 [Xylariaceae sp. AK1471]|nr:hypothetical protein HD806DRAFT_500615 [Xylariaceae sp. AK1471]